MTLFHRAHPIIPFRSHHICIFIILSNFMGWKSDWINNCWRRFKAVAVAALGEDKSLGRLELNWISRMDDVWSFLIWLMPASWWIAIHVEDEKCIRWAWRANDDVNENARFACVSSISTKAFCATHAQCALRKKVPTTIYRSFLARFVVVLKVVASPTRSSDVCVGFSLSRGRRKCDCKYWWQPTDKKHYEKLFPRLGIAAMKKS